jgi:hypothetical protein
MLCALVFGILIGTVIGAVILRAAIALYNKMAGASSPPRGRRPEARPAAREGDEGIMAGKAPPQAGDTDEDLEEEELAAWDDRYRRMSAGVPEPTFSRAMGITFVTALVQAIAGFSVGFATQGAAAAGGQGQGLGPQILAMLISLPMGFLIMAAMLTAMLPTTFGRACIVTLLTYVIAVAIYVVVIVLFALVFGAAMMGGAGR